MTAAPLVAVLALSTSPIGGDTAVGYGVREDAAGRLVVAGTVNEPGGAHRFALWRFLENGKPDPAFADRGAYVSKEESWAWSLDLDAQGRAVAAGFTGSDWQKSGAAVARRWTTDGRPDPSFGKDGRVTVRPKGGTAGAFAVRACGGIVAFGGGMKPGGGKSAAALWRVDNNGKPLPQAVPAAPDDGVADDAYVNGLACDRDRLVATGHGGWERLRLWRFDSGGAPDPAFGSNGATWTPYGAGRGVEVGPHGRLWVSGFAYHTRLAPQQKTELAVLSRFLPNGRPDTTLAPQGALELSESTGPYRFREAFAIALSTSGVGYLAGYAGVEGKVRAAVWRVGPDGKPAMTVLQPSNGADEERAYAIVRDKKGRLVAVGYSLVGKRRRLALWRLNAF